MMKKIITLIITSFFFVSAFSEDFIASKEKCVDYLMVSLAKQYLYEGENKAFSGKDLDAARAFRDSIKIENVNNFTEFMKVIDLMENNRHKGGASKLISCKKKLLETFDSDNWKNQCKDRKVENDSFINNTWKSILKQNVQIVRTQEFTASTSEIEVNNNVSEINGRIDSIEHKVNSFSNITSYIALVLSIISLLGVAYLFYLQRFGKSKADSSLNDANYYHNNNRIERLDDRVESLRKNVENLKKQLEEQTKRKDDVPTQILPTGNQPPKKEEAKTAPEVHQSSPVKSQDIQRIFVRPKSTGILREAQDSSYFTIEIKNGKSEVIFTGDSMTAIKNQNQYFDGIYDIIERSGTNKVVVEKKAVALKRTDGTWMITEKGKLRFK